MKIVNKDIQNNSKRRQIVQYSGEVRLIPHFSSGNKNFRILASHTGWALRAGTRKPASAGAAEPPCGKARPCASGQAPAQCRAFAAPLRVYALLDTKTPRIDTKFGHAKGTHGECSVFFDRIIRIDRISSRTDCRVGYGHSGFVFLREDLVSS
jgi:hypothetical protein